MQKSMRQTDIAYIWHVFFHGAFYVGQSFWHYSCDDGEGHGVCPTGNLGGSLQIEHRSLLDATAFPYFNHKDFASTSEPRIFRILKFKKKRKEKKGQQQQELSIMTSKIAKKIMNSITFKHQTY